eukprot:gene10167-11846_t
MNASSPSTGVIITGGASGIGLASARALAAIRRPVALWDIDEAKAVDQAAVISSEFGIDAIGVGIDLTRADDYAAALATTRSSLPSIGGLVHSAGVE